MSNLKVLLSVSRACISDQCDDDVYFTHTQQESISRLIEFPNCLIGETIMSPGLLAASSIVFYISYTLPVKANVSSHCVPFPSTLFVTT